MSRPVVNEVDTISSSSALKVATSVPIVKLALRTAVVVGSLLNFINQGDALLGGASRVDLLKLGLTYLVPFCVATYSATVITLRQASAARA